MSILSFLWSRPCPVGFPLASFFFFWPGLCHISLELDAETIEKMTRMTAWVADRIESIRFKRDKESIFSGGGNGSVYDVTEPGSP